MKIIELTEHSEILEGETMLDFVEQSRKLMQHCQPQFLYASKSICDLIFTRSAKACLFSQYQESELLFTLFKHPVVEYKS